MSKKADLLNLFLIKKRGLFTF